MALRCGEFVVQQVVELLWACPLVVLYNMSVAGVRVVEFGTYDTTMTPSLLLYKLLVVENYRQEKPKHLPERTEEELWNGLRLKLNSNPNFPNAKFFLKYFSFVAMQNQHGKHWSYGDETFLASYFNEQNILPISL